MSKVFFINNDGGGFADSVDIQENETISAFLARTIPNFNPANYHIRFRSAPGATPVEVTAGQMLGEGNVVSAVAKPGTVNAESTQLSEGARVTVTPKKVAGAVPQIAEILLG